MRTKPLSRIIYAHSVTTKWVAIEKYSNLWDMYAITFQKRRTETKSLQ